MKGLLTSLITVLTFTGLQAQSLPAAPKLVVGLTIDQLRTDYLEAFSSLYGEKGFKRLWKEGRVFHNAEYTFCGIDRASAIAAIYSGTTPSMNGIISQRWMDASTLRPVNSTDDTAFMGYYTDQTVAPTKLLTSTIADELKIATQGKGLVYAIAPDCDAAPGTPSSILAKVCTVAFSSPTIIPWMYSAICLAENSIILSNSLCSKCFSFVTCVLHVSVNTSLIMQITHFFFIYPYNSLII